MTEITEPGFAYIILFIGIILGAVGIGWFLAEQVTGTVVGAIILALFGFVGGIHVSSNRGEWVGFLLVAGGFSAIIAYFLPMQIVEGVAAFGIGYVLGLRTERRA